MLLSVIAATTLQALTRYLGASTGAWTKTFYRCAFTILFILIWIAVTGRKIRLNNTFLLLVRGIMGAFAITFYFWTIDLIDLLHGTLYVYAHPAFAVAFAAVFYRERFSTWMAFPLVSSLAGLLLIVNPTIDGFGFGDLVGLISMITAGVARATVRELRKTDTPETIVFVHMSATAVFAFAGVLVIPAQTWHVRAVGDGGTGISWAILIAIGLLSAVSLISMTAAFRKLSTSAGSILQLLIMPATAIVATVVFKEPLTEWSIVGGLLILLSSVAVTIIDSRARSI